MAQDKETCIIVGAGSGLSASLARLFSAENMSVVLAARDIQKLKGLREEINCDLVQCDVTNIDQVESLFAQTDQILGKPSVVVYNPSARIRGDITSLDPAKTKLALETTCYGAFLVAQQAAIRMTKIGRGSIFFTGASAGIKGFPNSSVFAMGKFGLRGLAQSLARELQQKIFTLHISLSMAAFPLSYDLILENKRFWIQMKLQRLTFISIAKIAAFGLGKLN